MPPPSAMIEELENVQSINCPKCGKYPLKYWYGFSTLVGFPRFIENGVQHDHDDNCREVILACRCGKHWIAYFIRTCKHCKWTGKKECFCHPGEKLEWPGDIKKGIASESPYARAFKKMRK